VQAGHDNAKLAAIQARIVARQFDDALLDLAEILQAEPDNVEALYMSAVCYRYQREFEPALGCLQRLKSLEPEHGRAYQEEGHAYRDMGRSEDALQSYSLACRFNPALIASWRGQHKILADQGEERQAVQVLGQLEHLQALPPALLAVMDLVAQGRLLKAEDICRQYLLKIPHDVEGMRLLADIGMRLGVLDDAEFLLESALKFKPDNIQVRIDYVQVLRKRQKFAKALDQARQLLERSPQNPQFLSIYGVECMQNGDYAAALQAFDQVLQKLPDDPVTLTAKGHAFKTTGQYDDAVAAYRAAIASRPNYGEACYSLANLKVYEFSDQEIEAMQAQESSETLAHADRIHFCFALGKAYEDRKDFDTAFRFYARGNRLKKTQSRYTAEQMSDDLQSHRQVFTAAFFADRAGRGHAAADPIFIVGLPRAGSTLLEQILSSHSMVDGTLELPNIPALSQRLRRRARQEKTSDYPEILAELGAQEQREFGEAFIEDTRIHRQGAPYFIDKMPNNFRHIGLIQMILPNATIIDARRHPLACCFSGFKQLFAEGQEFSYDLRDIGRYYADYVDLMDHWDAVLPGKVLRVQYEDVVADLESELRRILAHCGLPFEENCLEFHRTDRSVRTPSSEQVRQPIFDSGLEQWRNFDAFLEPLKSALGPVLERYPIDSSSASRGD
jgi:tetratricopeptide (TPR) repeat protein